MRRMTWLELPVRLWGLLFLVLPALAAAQSATGFSLGRYEPTSPGSFSLSVEQPRYAEDLAVWAALTGDYGHDPLILGRRTAQGFVRTATVIEHQLLAHLGIGLSFKKRFGLGLNVPLTLLETGQASAGLSPISGLATGDVRLSGVFQAFGSADDGLAGHVGLSLWGPIGGAAQHSGDKGVRLLPKFVLTGKRDVFRLAASAGFLYRPIATLGGVDSADGATVGSELQLGAAGFFVPPGDRYSVGPELTFGSVVVGGKPFTADYTSAELLVSGNYNLGNQLLLGAAVGGGLFRAPGTPNFRALLRLAYTVAERVPPKDSDGDGVHDGADACVDVRGPAREDPSTSGCPDQDSDGVVDAADVCPSEPKGDRPDPAQPGCPAKDSDGDLVFDSVDACPELAAGVMPDPERAGCPLPDADKDLVADAEDVCPTVPAGDVADPRRKGCPDEDTDGDGLSDSRDHCPLEVAGFNPDKARPGCPLPDRDRDNVADADDACPDKKGAPDPNPKKNGCPGLVLLESDRIVISSPVFFATDKDVILPQSFPVLEAVTKVLLSQKAIKRLSVEGHTDDRGDAARNLDLSQRRADSVLRFLVEKGVELERLEAHGFGVTKPVADNKASAGRARNRRVEFRITDLAQ